MNKEICKSCHGTGQIIGTNDFEICTSCNGVGYFEAKDGGNTQTGEEAPSLTGIGDKSGQR